MALVVAQIGAGKVSAQTFDSGSDDTDGALILSANQGTVTFDPADPRWGRVLDPDGDGVYNFTSISIAAGTTLRFTAAKLNRPIYLLASGTVAIAGSLDLSGSSGVGTTDLGLRRTVALPGSGGFAGGAGGISGSSFLASPGDGPGGGAAAPANCASSCNGTSGSFAGNRYLLPLIGGSGGGGANWTASYFGGGAGGGAILIASSASVSVTGTVLATGGAGASGVGGAGSGGAIRLVAPTLSGNGTLDVRGGNSGMVRLEAFSGGTTFVLPAIGAVTRGTPVDASTLRPTSAVRVTAIGGVPVPVTAAGSFSVPDVVINSATAVAVDIEASGVPPGTVVTLQVFPETPNDPAILNLPPVQATLSGNLQQSTATVNFSFPYGFSRGFLRATWIQ